MRSLPHLKRGEKPMRGYRRHRTNSYKNVGATPLGTVPDCTRTRKDIKMKLLIIFAGILAISIAEDVELKKELLEDDSQAEASEEGLQVAASSYSYGQENPSAPKPWEPNYVPPTQNNYYQTQSTQQSWNNQNKYRPDSNYNTPSNNYNPPSNNYNPPSNNYNPPSNNYNPPSNNYNPPSNNYNPSQSNNNNPSNNYNKPVQSTWQPPTSTSTTTTSVPIIKNEQFFGENGSYKYEYEIADGTHVGEEGYFLNPNTENEIIVKKGWYTYKGADGKVYTVTYWADDTGYHASGDHLPKAPPIPPAIQASIDQNAKEEAAQAEAEKNKPQQGGSYPQQQQPPKPLQPQPAPVKPAPPRPQYPQQQYPQQQYPQQQYPQQQYPQQQYPQQQYPQQQYPQQQYPQQTQPPQQTYYPQQTTQTQQYYPQESYPSSSGYGK